MSENTLARSMFVVDGRDLFRDTRANCGDVLVVLGTPACGACRRVKALLRTLTIQSSGGGTLAVAEVDATHAMGLVDDWEVFHLPALMLLRDGEPWRRVEALLAAEPLAAAILAARSKESDPELC